ncbi:hypothetical protein GOODEAATRI_009055 [Goodea atripinnis]|uniref:Uncharacterized protein n=1 Tax=Goodea atripinnis TaxID=208336 RepID=A0ABV0P2L9_9TELE
MTHHRQIFICSTNNTMMFTAMVCYWFGVGLPPLPSGLGLDCNTSSFSMLYHRLNNDLLFIPAGHQSGLIKQKNEPIRTSLSNASLIYLCANKLKYMLKR